MAKASYTQDSFLGGEWSPRAIGKLSDPRYRISMSACLNGFPLEEASWVRRPAFQLLGPSYYQLSGKLLSMTLNDGTRAELEFTSNQTASFMRIWCRPYQSLNGVVLGAGPGSVSNPYTIYCDVYDTAVISAGLGAPAVITTGGAHTGWANGDLIELYYGDGASVSHRHFMIVPQSSNTFWLYDPTTSLPINDNLPDFAAGTVSFIGHIKVFVMPYTTVAQVKSLRRAQSDTLCLIFDGTRQVVPQTVKVVYISGGSPNLVFSVPVYDWRNLDGPYQNALNGTSQTSNSPGTIDNFDSFNSWDFTLVNPGDYTFTTADIAKPFRAWNQPAAYNPATTYTNGQYVTYNGEFWLMAQQTGAPGTAPGQTVTNSGVTILPWQIAPGIGLWSFGFITSVVSASEVVVYFNAGVGINPSGNTTMDIWQLGAYYPGSFPTCGVWNEGRLWLMGAVPNRFDATITNISANTFSSADFSPSAQTVFSPTDTNGNVLDSSAISETVNAPEINEFHWGLPDAVGIIMGTLTGEWLVESSTQGEPITPTSIRAKHQTKYTSMNSEPVRTGAALVMISATQQRVWEYLVDAFSGKFTGRLLNQDAGHFAEYALTQLVYADGSVPIIWAIDAVGQLFGCTYRRLSRFVTQPPEAFGWHRHAHGANRWFESLAEASSADGTYQGAAAMTTFNPQGQAQDRLIEFLSRPLGATDTQMRAAFCDEFGPNGGGDNITQQVITPPGAKLYFEMQFKHTSAGNGQFLVGGVCGVGVQQTGLFTSGGTINFGLGNIAVAGRAGSNSTFINASVVNGGWDGYTDGDWIGVAVDLHNKLIWFKDVTTGGDWNLPAGGGSPGGTGGLSISGLTQPIYPFMAGSGFTATDECLLNTTGSFVGALPTGFTAWGSTAWSSNYSNLAYGSSAVSWTFTLGSTDGAVTDTVNAADTTWLTGPGYVLQNQVWYHGHSWVANATINPGSGNPGSLILWSVTQLGVRAWLGYLFQ